MLTSKLLLCVASSVVWLQIGIVYLSSVPNSGWLQDIQLCRPLVFYIQGQIRYFHHSLFHVMLTLTAVLRENTACSAIIACPATIRQRFHPYKLLTSRPLNMIPCYHICFWSYRSEYVTMTFSVSFSFHPSVQLYTLIPMTQLYWLTLQSRLLTDFPQICSHASPSSLCPTIFAFIHLFTKFCFKKKEVKVLLIICFL